MAACSAYGCTNRFSKKIPGVSFHRFPSDKVLRQKWIIAIRRKDWFPTKCSRLCSAHFAENDIDRSVNYPRLKYNVVPTIFKMSPSKYKTKRRIAASSTDVNPFPSPLALKEAIQKKFRVPIIFKNRLKTWSHIPWTMEQLLDQYGSIPLNFRLVPKDFNGIAWEGGAEYVEATVSQFIKWQNNEHSDIQEFHAFRNFKPQDYWAYSSYNYMSQVFKEDSAIIKAVDWSTFGFPETSAKDSAFWIGSPGAYTPCHFDTYGCNLVAQIQGSKKWVLFPPEDTPFMYPTRIPYEESSVFSSVNILNPDFKAHCLFKFSHPHVVTLEPGDVLFVPKKWWHFVQSIDVTVSINTWIPLNSDTDVHLEEAVTRTLMTSFISYFEPEKESWLNPNEELASPNETLMFISSVLDKIKNSKEESDSSYHIVKSTKKLPKADVHFNSFGNVNTDTDYHEDIKFVTPVLFSEWYGKSFDVPVELSSDRVSTKNIFNCFVHPEVISVICKLLRDI